MRAEYIRSGSTDTRISNVFLTCWKQLIVSGGWVAAIYLFFSFFFRGGRVAMGFARCCYDIYSSENRVIISIFYYSGGIVITIMIIFTIKINLREKKIFEFGNAAF